MGNAKKVWLWLLCFGLLISIASFIFAEQATETIKPERKELIEKRNSFSKTFRNADGTDTIEVSSLPMHYQDENGKWQEIDTTIEDSSGEIDEDGEAFGFKVTKNTFETYLPKRSNGWTQLRYGKSRLGFKLMGGQNRSFAKKNKDNLLANDIFNDCYLNYSVKKGGFKEDIILDKASAARNFEYQLKLKNLDIKKSNDGSYIFTDNEGKEVFIMPKFVMYDAQKATSDDITVELEKQGNKYRLLVNPNQAWLNSKERVYPVVIDPSFIDVQFIHLDNKNYSILFHLYIPRNNDPVSSSVLLKNLSSNSTTINIDLGPTTCCAPKKFDIPVTYEAHTGDTGNYGCDELPFFKVRDFDPANPSDNGNILDGVNYSMNKNSDRYGKFTIAKNRGALVEMYTGKWTWVAWHWGIDCRFKVTYPNETMSPKSPVVAPLPPETYGTTVNLKWDPPADEANYDPATQKPYTGLLISDLNGYYVQYSTDPNFVTNVTKKFVKVSDYNSDTGYPIPGLNTNTTYYFRVYAEDKDLNPQDLNNIWDPYSHPSGIRWSNIVRTKCADMSTGGDSVIHGYTASQITDRVVSGDFDGDGKKDLAAFYDYGGSATRIHVWLSTGSSFQYKDNTGWWSVDSGYAAGQITGRVVAGDYNGDGKDDIAAFYDYGNGATRIHVWLSNGSSFQYQNGANGWWSVASGYAAGQITGRVVAGDYNGDGKDDIAAFYDYGSGAIRIHIWLSNGSSFLYQNANGWWNAASGYNASQITGRVVSGDYNGDGKDDIAALYDYGSGTMRIHVWLTTGSALQYAWWNTVTGYSAGLITKRVVSGDYNGDGKDDIAAFYDCGNGSTRIDDWLSTGSSFQYQNSNGWWNDAGNNIAGLITGRVVSGDYNKDGKDDIAVFYDGGSGVTEILVWLSTGTSYQYQYSIGWWYNPLIAPIINGINLPNSNSFTEDDSHLWYYINNRIFTVSWEHKGCLTQTQAQLGISEYYDSPKIPVEYSNIAINNSSNSAITNWNLPDGRYVVYVRTSEGYGWSPWSDGTRLVIDTVPPALPAIVVETVPDSNDKLKFTFPNGINEKVKYKFYWGTDPNNLPEFISPSEYQSYGNGSYITVSNLGSIPNHYYYFVFYDKALNETKTPIYSPSGGNIANVDINHLGQESYWNYKSITLGRAGNAQVNLNNGDLNITATDFSLPGRGIPVTMTRYYNSQDDYQGMLGRGWRTAYEIFLQIDATDGRSIFINDPDGSRHRFQYVSDTQFNQEAPKDYRKVIKSVADGAYTVTEKDGTRYKFNAPLSGIAKLSSIEDRFGNVLTLSYNADNLVASVTEPSGKKANFSYNYTFNGKKYLTLIDFGASNNRYISYSYLGNSFGANLTDVYYQSDSGDLIDAKYGYDAYKGYMNSSAVKQGNEGKNSTQFYYKIASRSIDSVVSSFTDYDYISKIPTSITVKHYFDYQGNVTFYTDPKGTVYQYIHDTRGRCVTAKSPGVNDINYVYNDSDYSLDNVSQYKPVDESGNGSTVSRLVTTKYGYDANGNVISTVADQGYKNLTTLIEYEPAHRDVLTDIKSVTDPRNKVTKYINSYDPTTYKLKEIDIQPQDDYTIKHKFNDFGERTDKDVILNSKPAENLYQFDYEYQNGLLTKLTNYYGSTTYGYTYFGERNKELDANGTEQDYAINPYTGNLHSVPVPFNGANSEISIFKPTTVQQRNVYEYDANGNKTAEYDAKNNITHYYYDELNQLYRVQSPSVQSVKQYDSYKRYDKNGNLIESRDYDGKVLFYEYDALNRRTKVLDSRRDINNNYIVEEESGYDVAGRIKWRYDGKRDKTEYFYDSADNLVFTKYYDAGNILKYTAKNVYDENGNITSKEVPISSKDVNEDGKIMVTSTQYDAANRPDYINIYCKDTNITKYNQTVDYTYQAGQLQEMTVTVAGGAPQTYTYSYDNAQRLQSLTRKSGATLGERVKLDYYPGGQRRGKSIYKLSTDPDSAPFITVDYRYDTAYRLLHLDYKWGNYSTLLGYDYNEIDKITDNTIAYNINAPSVVNYLLDKLPPNGNGYTRPTVPNTLSNAGLTNHYTYDDLGRMASSEVFGIIPSISDKVYQYGSKISFDEVDPNGNPIKKNTYSYDGVLKKWNDNAVEEVNSYDPYLNRLVSKKTGNEDLYSQEPDYDLNGSLTKEYFKEDRPASTNEYGLDNQLLKSYSRSKDNYLTDKSGTSVKCYNETTETYSYEFGGKLLSTHSNIVDYSDPDEQHTHNYYDNFYYSHDGVVAEQYGYTGSLKNFTRLGRELIACNENSGAYFYIQNLRGDVIMLVKVNGDVSSIRDYNATGSLMTRVPEEGDDPFGFTGGMDAGNGLWKLGARFYDSSKSAFTQQDRYLGDPSDPLSLNRYVYCGMDPVNYVDPTGFMGIALFGQIGVEFGFDEKKQWGMSYQAGIASFQNGGAYTGGDRIAYQTTGSIMKYADVNTKQKGEQILGGYGGAGVGVTFTSADSAKEFANIPKSFNVNTMIGSISIGYGNGNFALSISVGPGAVGSLSNYETETDYMWW